MKLRPYVLLLLSSAAAGSLPATAATSAPPATEPAPAATPSAERPPAAAPEEALAKLLAGRLAPGTELLWLEGDGGRHLALLRQANRARPQGNVLLLPGRSGQPAWPEVMAPLLRALSRYGWNVLAPYLPPPPEAPEGREDWLLDIERRLDAARTQLTGLGADGPLVAVGYEHGAAIAQHYAQRRPQTLQALATISPMPLPGEDDLPLPTTLPVLDLRAALELPRIQDLVAKRALLARRQGRSAPGAHPSYRLITITGAEHGYRGFEAELGKRLLGWLRSQTAANDLIAHSPAAGIGP